VARSINNVTAPAAYATAATLEQAETSRVNFQVTNAAIYYQLGDGTHGSPRWLPEVFLLPGVYSFDRSTNGVRVRSATATPAQVTVDALTQADLGAA
jgi:hypothetical protein